LVDARRRELERSARDDQDTTAALIELAALCDFCSGMTKA
jgi:hypothetical protein